MGGLELVFTTVRLAPNPFLSAGCHSELSGWFSGTRLIFLLFLLCLSVRISFRMVNFIQLYDTLAVSCLLMTIYVAVFCFPHFIHSLAVFYSIIGKLLKYVVLNSSLSGDNFRSTIALISPFWFWFLRHKKTGLFHLTLHCTMPWAFNT